MDESRTYIGIDPGSSGGIAIIRPDGRSSAFPTPYCDGDYDEGAMRELLDMAIDEGRPMPCAIIERVHSMPSQGVASMFSFGAGYGLWRGMCAAMRIPYRLVPPQTWQKVMLAGEDKSDKKAASVRVARRLFPDVSLRKSERGRVDHHGMADALLIAEYGRRNVI